MFFMKLHRFLELLRSLFETAGSLGLVFDDVARWLEDICEIILSKDVNMSAGLGLVSLRMMTRRRLGAGLHGADDGRVR